MIRTQESAEAPAPRSEAGLLAVLRGSAVFAGLHERQLAALAGASARRTIERGEPLFRAGEVARSLTVISSGMLKMVRHTADMTECILGLFGPRESVGLVAALERRPYPATALALSERVDVVSVRIDSVLEMMAHDAALSLSINRALVYHTRILHEKIDVMSAGAVPQRLASLLLALAGRFGDEREDGTTFVPLALSRGELSSLVGSRVETTIRTLSRWQRQGWVHTTREGFDLLDLPGLQAVQQGKFAED